MPRSRNFARVVSSISTFTTSIDASPPPTTSAPSRASNTGPEYAGLVRVVEPDDERILVDQAAALVRVGALDRQRPIAPRAAREHHAREAPLIGELAEADVAADLGARNERHVRKRELAPDRLVFLLAQRDVPARQTVFDLAVRAAVLFEHRHFDAALGERARHFGARDGTADHCDTMRRLGRTHRGCIVTGTPLDRWSGEVARVTARR